MNHDVDPALRRAAGPELENLDRMEKEVSGLLKRVVAQIRENLFTPEFTAENLMRTAGASRSTLNSFRTEFDTTPRRFIYEARMSTTSRLLRDTSISIEEIAFLVGYEASPLHRAFKRWCGLSPSSFRAHARKVRPLLLQLPDDVMSPAFFERFQNDELSDEEISLLIRHLEAVYDLRPEENPP